MGNLRYIVNTPTRFLFSSHKCDSRRLTIFKRLFSDEPQANEEYYEQPQTHLKKIINVAVLGTPNAGKSTLINKLLNRPLCPVSKKVHTTKELARATCHIEDTQIVFMDTPGVVSEKETKKYNLPGTMINACRIGKNNADLLAILYDASSIFPPALPALMPNFLKYGIPAVLVLNKVDLVKKKHNLLDLVRILTGETIKSGKKRRTDIIPENKMFTENNRGYKGFQEVFLVSALNGDGVPKLMEYFVQNGRPCDDVMPAPPLDMPPEKFIVETVRSKLLDFLPQEIPYRLKPQVELYEEASDRIVTAVCIRCPSLRIAKLISGSACGRLRKIQDCVRDDLTQAFNMPVKVILQTLPPVTDHSDAVERPATPR